jgi:recombination protein RecR
MSERIAYHILKLQESEMREFVETIEQTYSEMKPCPVCGHWDNSSPCRICQDSSRDKTILCVVENSQDILAISRIKNFNGVYHVLGGTLSPLDGIGPEDIQINSLMNRIETEPVREVILALNSDIEGETTAQYLARQIQNLSRKARNNGRKNGIRVTRPAQGLPAGGELEYMDEITLTHAFQGRRDVS